MVINYKYAKSIVFDSLLIFLAFAFVSNTLGMAILLGTVCIWCQNFPTYTFSISCISELILWMIWASSVYWFILYFVELGLISLFS